jgi:hypothetical protein
VVNLTYKSLGILVLVAAVVGAAGCYWLMPTSQSTTFVDSKETTKTDVRTITKIVEKPDGSRQTIIETTDNSTKVATEKQTIKTDSKKWAASVGVQANYTLQPEYFIMLERKVFSNVSLGLMATTDAYAGVYVQIAF